MIKKLRKKSQEEIVGFVLIIVLVAVIVLIFLAISIRKSSGLQKSKDIENFLHSSLLYAAECKPSPEIVYDLRDLITACYNNEKCLNEEQACNELNRTFIELIEDSFQIGEESKYKAYVLDVYMNNETVLNLTRGNLTSDKIGSEVLIPVSGESVNVNMKLYY